MIFVLFAGRRWFSMIDAANRMRRMPASAESMIVGPKTIAAESGAKPKATHADGR